MIGVSRVEERGRTRWLIVDCCLAGWCRRALTRVMAGRPCEAPLRQAASWWPRFAPAAEKIIGPDGVVWAIPMRVAGDVIGAIGLFACCLELRRRQPVGVARPQRGSLLWLALRRGA